jgi:hypothetical protein
MFGNDKNSIRLVSSRRGHGVDRRIASASFATCDGPRRSRPAGSLRLIEQPARLLAVYPDGMQSSQKGSASCRSVKHAMGRCGEGSSPPFRRWLTSVEAAQYLGLTLKALNKRVERSTIPFSKLAARGATNGFAPHQS